MLTVYGIETHNDVRMEHFHELQQCLLFTVLKLNKFSHRDKAIFELQQCLLFTVLKLSDNVCELFFVRQLQQCLLFTVLKL